MQNIEILPLLILIVALASCKNPRPSQPVKTGSDTTADSIIVIEKKFKNSEVTELEIPVFKNTNIKHGVQKRYYSHGSLYSEIPYNHGKREGVAYTYYPVRMGSDPVVWKEQVYKNDKLDGICKRYHKNGVLQAEYEYKKGLAGVGLKEFKDSGIAVKLPELIVNVNKLESNFYISARLSNGTTKVDYFIGELIEGKYLSENQKGLQVRKGVGEILVPLNSKSVTITAVYTTQYRNKYLVSKTLEL